MNASAFRCVYRTRVAAPTLAGLLLLLPPTGLVAQSVPPPAGPSPAKSTAPAPPPGLPPALAKQPAPPAFIRYLQGAEGDALQTAIVSYERRLPARGQPTGSDLLVKVDLVGAVHIADKAYFDDLNQRFKQYQAVLYELVGPAIDQMDKDPALKAKHLKDRENLAWVGMLQARMKEVLGLHGQLESIDYRAANFVHADMDTPEFTKVQEQKQESFLSLYFRAAMAQKEVNAERGIDSDAAGLVMLLKMLTAKDTSTGLKRLLAQQFESVGDVMAGVESGKGTVILGERNRVALEVLDKQVQAGKRRLAVFYGAAHLGDMEERLKKRGYTRVKTEWVTAWDLPHD